ncbi:MAG: competence/damage-inducible protein A [Oscillospiraceae bacterium]|nr:competence/damage-inducible protein A [Oscillospiraceae bacterium]
MHKAEVISVGTELVLGEITDTNAPFLSRELAGIGIAVERRGTVGDNPARLREDFLQALSRSDIVLLTGGLGPTPDDLTKETVAEALGLALETDELQLRRIEDFFRKRTLPMPEDNRKQAMVPKGCTVLYNENGTAPGCWIKHGSKRIALLPGPPREMKPMFRQLLPLLAPFSSGVILSHHLRTVGLGESRMAQLAEHYLDLTNPTVAPYAKDGESYLRVSAAAATREEAEALCRPVLRKLTELLGSYVYAVDEGLAQTVTRLLRAQGKTVALAESCTGGGIAQALTELPGASDVFGWGVVSYANECKQALLGVPSETLQSHGAVSAECAMEMARGIRRLSGAAIGLAVTGIAGPGSGGEAKPAGLIFLAATDGDRSLERRLETGRGDRAHNRLYAAKQAFDLLRRLLLGI